MSYALDVVLRTTQHVIMLILATPLTRRRPPYHQDPTNTLYLDRRVN